MLPKQNLKTILSDAEPLWLHVAYKTNRLKDLIANASDLYAEGAGLKPQARPYT